MLTVHHIVFISMMNLQGLKSYVMTSKGPCGNAAQTNSSGNSLVAGIVAGKLKSLKTRLSAAFCIGMIIRGITNHQVDFFIQLGYCSFHQFQFLYTGDSLVTL